MCFSGCCGFHQQHGTDPVPSRKLAGGADPLGNLGKGQMGAEHPDLKAGT